MISLLVEPSVVPLHRIDEVVAVEVALVCVKDAHQLGVFFGKHFFAELHDVCLKFPKLSDSFNFKNKRISFFEWYLRRILLVVPAQGMYEIITVLALPIGIHNHSQFFVFSVVAIFEEIAFVMVENPTVRQMRQFSQE